jgi:hypothetical protein
MLRISIPSTGPSKITFNKIRQYDIPQPPLGFVAEVNDDATLVFEDEQQAIDYAHALNESADSVDQSSYEFMIITDIIKAIGDDQFVQAYIQS